MNHDKELIQAQYDDFAAQHQAAYAAFKSIYETKNPPPERERAKAENGGMVAALIVLVTASVIVSGSRTINEFGGGVVGLSAFVMLELGIITYAYIRTRVDYDEDRFNSVKALLERGKWLAFVVAVAANLHATLADRIKIEALNVAILVLVAISAPVLAFISGDVAGMLSAVDSTRKRRTDAKYGEIMKEYLQAMNASWAREKANWGVKIDVSRVQTDRPLLSGVSVSERTDSGQTRQTGYGFNRTSDGQQTVIEYLNRNPQDAALPSRKLAKMIGVGHDTANKGRNAWAARQNGQHLPDDAGDTEPAIAGG